MIPKTTGRITEMVNSKGFEDYVDWYQEGFEAAREEASRVSDEIPYAGAAAYLAWWLAKRGEAPLLRLVKRDRGDATVEVLARRLGRSWLYEECPWAPPASPFDGAGE